MTPPHPDRALLWTTAPIYGAAPPVPPDEDDPGGDTAPAPTIT